MTATPANTERLVCVGEIAAPHGVKGGLRIRSFTEPPARLFSYALQDRQGMPVLLVKRGGDARPELFIGELPNVKSREAAEAMRGTQLFVERAALPPADADEYYLSDLIGLRARTEDGIDVGRIIAVPDFGAGPILEVKPAKGHTLMLPFTDDFVPTVDIAGGVVTIVIPVEIDGEPRGEAGDESGEEPRDQS